eukprot:3450508-Prymnesium_polylepis.1
MMLAENWAGGDSADGGFCSSDGFDLTGGTDGASTPDRSVRARRSRAPHGHAARTRRAKEALLASAQNAQSCTPPPLLTLPSPRSSLPPVTARKLFCLPRPASRPPPRAGGDASPAPISHSHAQAQLQPGDARAGPPTRERHNAGVWRPPLGRLPHAPLPIECFRQSSPNDPDAMCPPP